MLSGAILHQDLSKSENSHFATQNRGYRRSLDDAIFRPDSTLLLLFPKTTDPQCVAFADAADSMQMQYDCATTLESAASLFEAKLHSVVVIDARNKKIVDPNSSARVLRECEGSSYSVFVAVRGYGSQSTADVLIDAGFDQEMVETCQTRACVDELLYLRRRIELMAKLRIAEAILVAVHWADESFEFYDTRNQIKYVNPACVKMLGYSHQSELIGQDAMDAIWSEQNFPSTSTQIDMHLLNKQVWQGSVSLKKKSDESTLHMSRVIPLSNLSGQAAGTVVVRRTDSSSCAVCTYCNSCPSSKSNSKNVSGSEYRRSSVQYWTKQSILPNNIVEIVTHMKEDSSPETAALLDKILEEIEEASTTPITAPAHLVADVIAEDLFGGLMTTGPIALEEETRLNDSARRSIARSISDGGERQRTILDGRKDASINLSLPYMSSDEVVSQLDAIMTWRFDVIALETATKKRPLIYGGFVVLQQFDVMSLLSIDEQTVLGWLAMIESNYRESMSYHNSTHAADVMQAAAYLCTQPKLMIAFDDMDRLTLALAAIIHDLDHPGRTNPFLINSRHKLAVLYNDISVLENHHVSTAFQLMKKNPAADIFQNLERDEYKLVRQQIIDLVLATDMSKHYEHVNRFAELIPRQHGSILGTPRLSVAVNSRKSVQMHSSRPSVALSDSTSMSLIPPEQRIVVKRMIIKCSDVSNPVRPLELCKAWAQRISVEYFDQTDEEKANGYPVVMPHFDRLTCSIPKTQITFTDIFINQMMELFDSFTPIPEMITFLRSNYVYWKEEFEKSQKLPDDNNNTAQAV